ncbi:hypothetical protein HOC13_02770 [Candidatus Woesearchaeota archaeon]|jgi:hypothetical protein|nr:hypothetical protein [Candidatus Woesearchaeota archaeon]
MTSYKATTLRDLKQTDSGIHVTVEAMPLSGKSDGNGGHICSLAREGAVIPATINQTVYDFTQEVNRIYRVQGRWNGTELEVHHVEAKGLVEETKPHEPKGPLYDKNYVPDVSKQALALIRKGYL